MPPHGGLQKLEMNKMNGRERMIDIEETPLRRLMLPEVMKGYEVIRYQCVNDANDVSAICRTPYGGVAEVRCETDLTTTPSACPICNSTMKNFRRSGLFVCDHASHAPLWMATQRYQPHQRASMVARKPTVLQNQDRAIMSNIQTEGTKIQTEVDMESIKSQLQDALGDLL